MTFESVSACDLKKAGADRYWEDITTDILCCSFAYPDDTKETWFPGEPLPPRVLRAIEDGKTIFVAHNARFERAGWREHMAGIYGFPDIPLDRWHDTLARCAQLALPQGLDQAGRALDLVAEKDMEGSRLTIGLSRVNKKTGMMPVITSAILERVGVYCEGDVVEQREMHRRVGWLPPAERKVWLLDQVINDRGVGLDMPLVRSMAKIVEDASKPLAAEFEKITGLKMTQTGKMGSWLADQGVWLPNMQKETLAAVIGETEDGEEVDEDDRLILELPPHVDRALRIRQLIGSASVKKLSAMQACVCSDGRARGLLQYHGAGPGRWAGRLLQPQNFPRGTTREDHGVDKKGERILKAPNVDDLVAALMTANPDWIEAIYGPAVEVVVSSLRHAIVARKGCLLLAGDFAGIEARLTLALAGQHDKTALMASGVDVYCDMATSIFKRIITKADVEERQIGKNSVLGLGFAMGADKFHTKYAKEHELDFIREVVQTYRKEWAPLVPALWRALEDAAIRTVHYGRPHEAFGITFSLKDRWLEARYPDDSVVNYYDPKPIRKAVPWDEEDIRMAFTYRAQKTGRLITVNAFGGLLTENAAQHMARQLMVEAMFKCEDEGLPIILTVHDEIVCEPEAGRADEGLLKAIMEDRPSWAKAINVPVASECWAGERYKK